MSVEVGKAMNIREVDGDRVYIHLPNDYHSTAGFHTLCGLCDVSERLTDTRDPVDCETCVAVLEHVLALAAERGVIRSRPSDRALDRVRRVGR